MIYFSHWSFSLKETNPIQLARETPRQCFFAQHVCYFTELGRLRPPLGTTQRWTRKELTVYYCPMKPVKNLTPCKAEVCTQHHCFTDSTSIPCGMSDSLNWNSPPLPPAAIESRFLWCSYSSVSKTLSPLHSFVHKPLCLRDTEKSKFQGRICL